MSLTLHFIVVSSKASQVLMQNQAVHSDSGYSLAVVENRPVDLDGEARGAVEAVPGGVGRGAGVRLEGDVGPHGGRGRPRPRRGPGGTGIWKTAER